MAAIFHTAYCHLICLWKFYSCTVSWNWRFFFQRHKIKKPPHQYRIPQPARPWDRSSRNHLNRSTCRNGLRTWVSHKAPADTSIAASSEGRNRCRIQADSGLGESTCQVPETKITNVKNHVSEFKKPTSLMISSKIPSPTPSAFLVFTIWTLEEVRQFQYYLYKHKYSWMEIHYNFYQKKEALSGKKIKHKMVKNDDDDKNPTFQKKLKRLEFSTQLKPIHIY